MVSYNIGAQLRERAREQPRDVALRFMRPHAGPGRDTGRELTFSQLEEMSDRYARGFEASGLRRGDRTLVLATPTLDFVAFMFGLFKMGAVPVLMDPGMGMRNLLGCIAQVGPRAVVAVPLVHAVRTFARRPFARAELFVTVGSRWFWGGTTLDRVYREGALEDTPYPVQEHAGADEAAIIFTSGSTGPPKGVSLTHEGFATVVRNIREAFDEHPGDVWMEAFTAFVFFDVCNGMTTVVPDADLTRLARVDPAVIAEALVDNECTGAFASPIVWARVLRHAEEHGLNFPSLERGLTTGAPIQADMHRRWQSVVSPGVQLHTPYGATECLTVSHAATREILGETWERTRQGWGTCVGRPYPGTTVRIVPITEEPIEAWSDDLQLPPGQIGEIVGDTPVASPEYKDAPEANRLSKIRRGDRIMHRMGDLGYLDDQGRLWFCGRKSHRLETADGVVPAVPVEGIFNEHDAVFRCALVGVGALGDEVPVLLVELEPGHAWSDELAGEILGLARGTRWEGLVREAAVHPGFPTDARHNSKIRRGILKEWAERRLGDAPGAAT